MHALLLIFSQTVPRNGLIFHHFVTLTLFTFE